MASMQKQAGFFERCGGVQSGPIWPAAYYTFYLIFITKDIYQVLV